MAAVIRIKLVDLLAVLAETTPDSQKRPSKHSKQVKLFSCTPVAKDAKQGSIDEEDLRAIQKYLKRGDASRRDLEFKLNMSDKMVLRRLDLLKERGIVKHLPGNLYGLTEEARPCTPE